MTEQDKLILMRFLCVMLNYVAEHSKPTLKAEADELHDTILNLYFNRRPRPGSVEEI